MSSSVIFRRGEEQIDVTKITRLYPAALIHAGGESASVSLEWAELKAGQIMLESYILVCDVDPIGEVPLNRIEFRYETKEELFEAMQEIAHLIRRG